MFKNIRNLSFLEIYFRFICVLFWPIYWYKWMVITIENYDSILFYIYSGFSFIFIFLLLVKFFRRKVKSKRYFIFAFSMVVTYYLTLLSFMILNTSRIALYAQITMCVELIYVSWKLIKIDFNDIGVVGILSGLLILILTYFY